MEEFSPEMLILYQKFDLENDLAAEENFYKISIFTSWLPNHTKNTWIHLFQFHKEDKLDNKTWIYEILQ